MKEKLTIESLLIATSRIRNKAHEKIKRLEQEFVDTNRKYHNGFKFNYQCHEAEIVECKLETRLTQDREPYIYYTILVPNYSYGSQVGSVNAKLDIAEIHIDRMITQQ